MIANYKKVYCTFFGYDYGYSKILCEWCKKLAVDIHHISPRGHSKCDNLNEVPNLVALCRSCHIKCNDKEFNKRVQIKHLKNIIKVLEGDGMPIQDI
jgi:5-methylcytosine-specific restriction endonuclease McrA